jgi:outer membrane lipoprotein-sorting protein
MKNIILFLIFVFGITLSSAQQDPEAKKILDKLSEKTKSYKVIKTDFTINYKNIKDNTQNTSSGSIVMKQDKYRMSFLGAESFFDGRTLWNYIPEVSEVNITEQDSESEDIFSNPKKLFTIYEEGYKYQFINNITEKNIEYSIVDLYPIDLEEDFSRIRLQINLKEMFLKSATIFGKDGSHYNISFNNYDTSSDFEDSYFIFNSDKYPDIEIIDMR